MPTGADAYIRYKREAGAYTGHDISGDTAWKVFGPGLKATPALKRKKEKITGLGGRQPTNIVTGELDLGTSLEFKLANPWWLRLLIGNAATTIGAGPYDHYWLDPANENATGALLLPNTIPAFTIENGLNLGTDSVRLYKGCFLQKATLKAKIGDPVDVKLTVPFRTIAKGTAGIASQTADTVPIMTFVQGTLSKGGVALASVQDVALELDNGAKGITGLGSEAMTNFHVGVLDVSMSASMYFTQDSDLLDVLLGGTTVPAAPTVTTLELVFDNGLATTENRTVEFKFTGVEIGESVLAQAVDDPLIEKFKPGIKALTLVKSTNNTAVEV
jgi:hypothetical protein